MSGIGSRFGRLGIAAVVVLALAACGKSSGTGSGGSTPGGGGGQASGGSGKATLQAGSVGSLGTVLEDSKGFTLYHLEGETTSHFMCTGSCTTTWPPLVASGTPSAGSGATGRIGTVDRPDGITQVTYDGLPVYTFSGDSAPGQSNGQGIEGAWFAVTPAGQSAKGGGFGGGYGGSSPSSGGKYGGY